MSEMNNVDNSFRTKLYNWRMANNLNQREAAVSLDASQGSIWKWENGKATPRAKELARILAIIEAAPAPAQEPEEEPWVPGVTEPEEITEEYDHVYTARPKTFRERMEQRYGGPEEYFKTTRNMAVLDSSGDADAKEAAEAQTPMPEEYPKLGCKPFIQEAVERAFADFTIKPTPSLVKLTEVIGFLKCLALYAAEGVAEPLEQQIKTLQTIAEEMSA